VDAPKPALVTQTQPRSQLSTNSPTYPNQYLVILNEVKDPLLSLSATPKENPPLPKSANGASLSQPRATPWVEASKAGPKG
jgi:hypothetical protein